RAEEILTDAASKSYGGAVLIERDDQIILRRGYGLANRERKMPFTTTTISQIGSLTKQFTAAAVAALAQKKRINYSDSVGRYLAGDPRLRGITIHQLLTHTAGIERDCGRDFERLTKSELLTRCIEATVQAGAAHKYKYSNLGYSLLGALVEQISGQSLEAFLINRVLRPAGMVNTRYLYTGRDPGLFARGYAQGKVQPLISDRLAELDDSWWNLKGNGGMQSTLDDMYAWYRSFKDGKQITAEMRHEILAPQVPAENGVFYGYGWFVRVLDGGNRHVYSHTGGGGGPSGGIILFARGRLVVVLSHIKHQQYVSRYKSTRSGAPSIWRPFIGLDPLPPAQKRARRLLPKKSISSPRPTPPRPSAVPPARPPPYLRAPAVRVCGG